MKNVLITRFSALGDVAMTIPVLYCVCRTNPYVQFYMLTRRLPASLFINAPANLNIITVDLAQYKGVHGLRRLCGELRSKYYIDAYADLHDVLRTKLMRVFMRLAGVKVVKIHKDRVGRRRLTKARNKVMLPLATSRAKYREVFWRLGLQRNDDFVSLFDREGFDRGCTGQGANPCFIEPDPKTFSPVTPQKSIGETWIAVAPFARHPGKVYPEHLMEQVVGELSRRAGYKIFLMGAGRDEDAVISRWRAKYGENIVNMAKANIGLPAELALLSHCNLMLSMDSANMHIASLVGLRVVSVWGATHPYCGFMGWHQRREDAVQLDMVCRPCSIYGNKPCRYGDLHCLEGIPPSLVLSHIDRALK